ncbi:CDP-alcohol phosphatidyltransferase family protein [Mesohalobacter halotolerans]|uniref:Phosphatidylserine synthase n=1 Tax=Mesohalobacter halotolerans TaxID=1883405 RepID=A0A4U5TQ27_9FLAO|nr:CDP-alcohol phosphatidyltransferase family protein [Mesohalobacter halotolerans]TKS56116.1 phosphatidylserine synthase [Mesohalobacter halotolerans]
MKAFIPNLITLLNLLMGCIGIYFAMESELILAAYCSGLGIFLDFFDGLAARLLKVSSELGKQLDSLADLVTSGVVPALVIFQLLSKDLVGLGSFQFSIESKSLWYAFIAFAITLGSAYRLAKFNIDENQTDKFIGLPTPANAILILSLPFILKYENIDWLNRLILNDIFLISLSLMSVVLLNMKVELFSLKLKSFIYKENKVVFLFLVVSTVMLVWLQFIAVPLIILFYILVSILNKKNTAKTIS